MINFSETTNYGNSNSTYDNYRLTIDNIEMLLKHKCEFNPETITDLVDIYIDLSHLISKCRFKPTQRHVLTMILSGDTYEKIADELGLYTQRQDKNGIMQSYPDYSRVQSTVRSISRKVYKAYEIEYQAWLEINGYIKIPSDVKYKRCIRCGRDMRIENFYTDVRNEDEVRGYCKHCE